MLNKTINEIKQNPHGKVARKAAHWLAVNVMGWQLKDDARGKPYSSWYVGETVPKPIDYVAFYKSHWQPFTDANHTRMLFDALPDEMFESLTININNRGNDSLNDLLFQCVLDLLCILIGMKRLTEDTMKGWWA